MAAWLAAANDPMPTTIALETHLRAITSTLELQVNVIRSALDLSTATVSLDFQKAANGAVNKFAKAIGELQSELLDAATGHPPEVTRPDFELDLESDAKVPLDSDMKVPGSREKNGNTSVSQASRWLAKHSPGMAPLAEVDGEKELAAVDEAGQRCHSPEMPSLAAVDEEREQEADSPVMKRAMSKGTTGDKSWDADMVATQASAELEDGEENAKPGRACVRGVFNPQWCGRLTWDFVVIFLVIIDGVVLPFQLAEFVAEGGFDAFWLWFTTCFFACDLVINFMTAFVASKKDTGYQEGTLVTDKIGIARHYFRSWFWIDFLSTVPWTIIGDVLSGSGGGNNAGNVTKITKVVKLTRLLRLMRMLRLAKIGVLLEQLEGHIGSLAFLNIVNLMKAVGVIFAICHWGACIWWMIGSEGSLVTGLTEEAGPDTLHWTSLPRVHSPYDDYGEWKWIERPTAEQYVFCFYWILGVMRTMPAEVTPVNLTERTFVLIFMLFAVASFAIFVAKITQAYFRSGARNDAFKEELACVRLHLRNINCNEALRVRTQAYLTHIFDRRKIHAKEINLINALPDGLKKKIMHARVLHHLRKLGVLKERSVNALKRVADICEVLDFLPGDRLTQKDRPAQAAWILMDGGLQIWSAAPTPNSVPRRRWASKEADREKKLTVVDEECLFAQDEEVYSRDTVIALECSEVLRVDRERFMNLMGYNVAGDWQRQVSWQRQISPTRNSSANTMQQPMQKASSDGHNSSGAPGGNDSGGRAMDGQGHNNDLRGTPEPSMRAGANTNPTAENALAARVAAGVMSS